jgi:hypothetical protein
VVRTVVELGGLLLVLVLNIAASVRVGRWDAIAKAQRAAWLVFIWAAPLLGSLLALQVTAEPLRGPPISQSSGVGIGDATGLDVGSHGGGHGGDGGGGH